jgi:peptidoglycan/LPS O-acetylase OafA/YrhL
MATAGTTARPVSPPVRPVPAHQNALDGIRALAALAVLLTHVSGMTGYSTTGTPVSWVLARGDVGVPIFFTLSGLLLYRKWAAAALSGDSAGRVAVYLRRRALRILPAYWVVVLIALPTLSPGPAHHVWSWLEYLLLLQNYDPHPWWTGTGAIGLAQAWSLVVEVSFYLVLPLFAAALTWFACRGGRPGHGAAGVSRRARRLLAGIAVLAASSVGWEILVYYPYPNLRFEGTLPPLMIWFCTGMAIAVALAWAAAEASPGGPASRAGRAVAASAGMCWLIAACAFTIACTPLTGPEFLGVPGLWGTEVKTVLYTLVAGGIVAPVAFQPLLADRGAGMLSARLLGSRPVRFLGKISYGIFLWQFLAAYAFFGLLHLKTWFNGGPLYSASEVALVSLVIALLTVAVSAVSYYLIEGPAQHFKPVWRWLVGSLTSFWAWFWVDERGSQPAHDEQADDLRDPVGQP